MKCALTGESPDDASSSQHQRIGDDVPKRWTHTACFEHFGTKPRNVNWSWSARNEETKTVAVTLWRHEFDKADDGTLIYERGPVDTTQRVRPGHTELMGNLRYAIDHCDGIVKIIIAVAKDPTAGTKQIASCGPTNMKVSVAELDEAAGSFKLVARMT
jgi:hypothetical protein